VELKALDKIQRSKSKQNFNYSKRDALPSRLPSLPHWDWEEVWVINIPCGSTNQSVLPQEHLIWCHKGS
jgi:hypothetical protein